jgi:hypothetical protein
MMQNQQSSLPLLARTTRERSLVAWGSGFLDRITAISTLSLRQQYLCLFAIVVACILLRLPPTLKPQLDRTLWKEIDYIEISRNYAAHGMRFLEPEITWPAEPPRVTAMELPAVPYAAAALYRLFGFQVFTVRLIPLLAFALMPIYLFFLVRDELGPTVALLASFIAALLPIHHPFGRIMFSEPVSILMSVAALFHFNRWARTRTLWHAFCAGLAFTLAVAVKFEPLFLLLPLSYLWLKHRGIRQFTPFCFFVFVALLLPTAWMLYAYHLSKTSIDVFGVVPFMRGHNKLQTFTMIKNPHFWLSLTHRVWTLSWGPFGFLLSVLGALVVSVSARARFFLIYLVTIGIYFVLVAEGQIDAPYRQLNAVPIISVLMAIGLLGITFLLCEKLYTPSNRVAKYGFISSVVVIAIIALPSYYSIVSAPGNLPAHPDAWKLAQQIRAVSHANDRLITLGEYSVHVGGNDVSPVLYYYSGMQGWTLQEDQFSQKTVDTLLQQGATLLAVDNEFAFAGRAPSPSTGQLLDLLASRYQVLYRSGTALLLRLSPPSNS